MELEYTYWQGKSGYLNIWPEHLTQGKDREELEAMLADLYEFYKEEQEQKLRFSRRALAAIPSAKSVRKNLRFFRCRMRGTA